ncbi:MAG: Thioredoxin, partial [uncultured Rubrobacteraceae bacterium]
GGRRCHGRHVRERGLGSGEAGHSGLLGTVVRAVPARLPDPGRDERGPRGCALREVERGRQPRHRDGLSDNEHPDHRPLRGRPGHPAGGRRPAQEPARLAARPV